MILFAALLACTESSSNELPDCPDGDTAITDTATDTGGEDTGSGGDTGGGGGGDTGGGGGGGGDSGGGGDTSEWCPPDEIGMCGELSGRAPSAKFAVALFPGGGDLPIAIVAWEGSQTFPMNYRIDATSFVDGTARPGDYTAKFIEDTNGDGRPDPAVDRVIAYPGTVTLRDGEATQGIDFVVP